MTSFTNKPETKTTLIPGGISLVTVEEKFSSAAAYQSIRFAGTCGDVVLVPSGGTAERSSTCRIASRPIGVSVNSRGAVRSFRSFPDSSKHEVSILKMERSGGDLLN